MPASRNRQMIFENASAQQGGLQREVAELIVQALNLDVAPDDIKADEPLYGDGLGLDSIDVLEIALVVSKRYGLQLRADNDDNHRIFSSLASLTDYIARHKAA
jgi:acyl carrier protein